MSKSPVYIGAGSQELAVASAQNIIDNAAEISTQHQEVVDIGATYHGAQTATPTSSVSDGHMWFDTNTGVNLLKFYNADTTTWEQAKLSDSNQTQVNTITEGRDGTTAPEVVCSAYYSAHTGEPYGVSLTSGHGGALLSSGVIQVGMAITGTDGQAHGIQAGTEVKSISSNNTITMTKPAILAVTNGQLTDNLTFGAIRNVTQVDVVADNIADVSAVADIDTEVTTVAGISSNVTTVAGISANTTTVAGISANVTTVAGISSNITTVAADGTDIGTVASNITDVNNFADLYQIDDFSPSDPTTDGGGNALAKGDLAFDTTADTIKVYNGTAWTGVSTVDGVIVKQEYTGNGSTKHYVLAHDQDMEIVYLNGIKLLAGDGSNNNDYFSVSGGSSTTYVGDGLAATHIYFHTAPATDFVISIVAWGASSNSLAVAKTGGTFTGTLNIGSDGTGQDVIFYGDTAGSKMTWDQSADALILTDSTPIHIGDNADLKIHHDGSHSYIENAVGSLKIATEDSGIAVSIGHTTSETTINDNLTVTGDLTVSGATTTLTTAAIALFDKNIEIGAVGTPTDSTADGGGLTLKGATDKTITWTNSLDSWVYNQGITVGVDGTGHDVTFYGDTATHGYMKWDQSTDDLIFGPESRIGIGTAVPQCALDITRTAISGYDNLGYTEMIHMYGPTGNNNGCHIGFGTGAGTSRIGATRVPLGGSDFGTDLRFENQHTIGGTLTFADGDVNVSTNTITTATHGLLIDTIIHSYDTVNFTTTETLPAGLALATTYWVLTVPSTTTFTLSSTDPYLNDGTGTPVVITAASGGGTHTLHKRQARRERMRITSDGDIGIGTITPTERLDVTGTVKAEAFKSTGGMTVDGATVFNEAGLDVDFRIESLNKDHIFFVDASVDRIGIGTSVCEEGILTVASDENNKTYLTGNQINFAKDGISYIDQEGTGGSIKFRTDGGQDRITIDNPITIHVPTTVSATLTATAFAGPLTGNADTATALATARAINGVDFDGSAAITVTAAADTLTATTLKSTVVTSSLTSVGTLGALTVSGAINGVPIPTTNGTSNVAIGTDCLSGHETGSDKNVAIGYQAFHGTLSDASNNIAIGNTAMAFATTGSNQTVSGDNNIAIGVQNFPFLTTGYVNIVIGKDAGRDITDGAYRTCIGSYADVTGDYGIAIGKSISAGGDTCVIGRSSNQISVDFSSTGTWSQSSDIRKKTDIQSCDLGLSFIDALRTTTFKFKPAEEYPEEWGHFEDELDDDGEPLERTYPEMDTVTKRYGMIAQEVKEAITEAGADDYFTGWSEDENGCQNLGYGDFVLPLIKAVQELSAKVTALENA